MILVGVDPGLRCTAACAYDPVRDAVLGCDSWRFGPRAGMTDPERVFAYCAALREFLQAWASVDVFAIEDQQAATIHSEGLRGRAGTRTLPEAVRAAVEALDARDGPSRRRAAERGGKNRSMIRLAKLAGALEQEAEKLRIRVIRVQPQEAKRALTGDAKAGKQTMQAFASLYGLAGRCGPTREWCNDHESDALGIALAARALLRQEELTDATNA